MRILLTSDLHYDIPRSQAPTEQLARDLCRAGGDLLVLVGDMAATDLAILERLFNLFESFPGPRLFTPGNHELWVRPGGDSLQRYTTELAQLCRQTGVHYLDDAPYRAGELAIVGSVGWYDYSFRPAALGIPLRFYQHKVAPGRALADDRYHHLVHGYDDLAPAARDLIVLWMDGVRVRLGQSDVDFTRLTLERLRAQLDAVTAGNGSAARHVVAAIHHLPFAGLVPPAIAPTLNFAGAFLGSELFGELLLEYPQVRQVYCGHAHRAARVRRGHLTATCIGSTYTEKAYETLDVD
ncbi:MAG: metallophosphoesterase [Phycisphaerae bacterium]